MTISKFTEQDKINFNKTYDYNDLEYDCMVLIQLLYRTKKRMNEEIRIYDNVYLTVNDGIVNKDTNIRINFKNQDEEILESIKFGCEEILLRNI
jgi:hypothetical protein